MPVITSSPHEGRYVVAHGLLMPDRFNRTAATILVDEICDPILVQVKADDTTDVTPYLAVLDDVADFTAGSDMPDVVRAVVHEITSYNDCIHCYRPYAMMAHMYPHILP